MKILVFDNYQTCPEPKIEGTDTELENNYHNVGGLSLGVRLVGTLSFLVSMSSTLRDSVGALAFLFLTVLLVESSDIFTTLACMLKMS